MTRIFLTKLPPEIPEHKGGVDLALFALRKVSGEAQSLVYDARGKPYVVGGRLFVSISNSRGVCAAAVSDRLVGVDIERRDTDPEDPRSFLPERSDGLLVRLAARWFREDDAICHGSAAHTLSGDMDGEGELCQDDRRRALRDDVVAVRARGHAECLRPVRRRYSFSGAPARQAGWKTPKKQGRNLLNTPKSDPFGNNFQHMYCNPAGSGL